MKNIYLSIILIVFVGSSVKGQDETLPVDPSTGLISFSEINESTNSKDILFKNAQTWIAKTYGDYKSVIQFEDKDAGKLIIKGISKINIEYHPSIKYTLEIDIKDKKYRSILTGLELGYRFLDDPTTYTAMNKLRSKSDVVNEYSKKIQNLEDELASSNSFKRKKISKELEEKKIAKYNYLSSYVEDREKIKEKVSLLFDSLQTSMSIKDDF